MPAPAPYKIDYSDSGLDPSLASAGNAYVKNGQVGNVPSSNVSVISSSQGKEVLDQHVADHTRDMQGLAMNNTPANGDENKPYDQKQDPNGGLTRVFNSKTGEQNYIAAGATPGPDWMTADEAGATGITIPSFKGGTNVDDTLNSAEKEINSAFDGFGTVYDAATANLLQSTKDLYSSMIEDERASGAANKNVTSNYLRQAGYTGVGMAGILDGIQQNSLDNIKKLGLEENKALAEANVALLDKKYSIFADKRNEIKAIREKKIDNVITLQKAALDRQDTAKRNQAIVNVMNQGITDPKGILTALNKNGATYTADDVEKVLKSLNPNGDLTKLSADARDFFVLKSLGGKSLPASITGLPEDQQLMAYIKMKNDAARKAGSSTGGGSSGTTDKVTAAEATKYGFPPEMIGLDEKEIRLSLDNPEPPQWFLDVMTKRGGGNENVNQSPGVTASLWDQFRQEVLSKVNPPEKPDTGASAKALDYFTRTYGDGLSEEQAQQLADRVDLYVQGGMSYAKAVAQTEKDANAGQ